MPDDKYDIDVFSVVKSHCNGKAKELKRKRHDDDDCFVSHGSENEIKEVCTGRKIGQKILFNVT